MRHTIYFSLLLLLFSPRLFAQTTGHGGQPQHPSVVVAKPETSHISIVDTLTAQEKVNRNAVILKSELDSLIIQYNASQAQPVLKEPVNEPSYYYFPFILAGFSAIIILLGFVIFLFYRHRLKINRVMAGLNEKAGQGDLNTWNNILPGSPYGPAIPKEKNSKARVLSQASESRIGDLNAEVHKLSKENENLNRLIKEYNGIQHEFDSLRHGILKTYKVKNYPGYDKSKNETMALQGVFQTENLVANYAYEKFLKPILAITDVNKNSPAKISVADREKLLDLLVSLSLLYIEYLYLRVNDLSIGGKMVERIKGFSSGNGLDVSLLKKLNTEFGSRALVLKMALSKAALYQLSYPVFDETNLNNQ